MSADVSALLTLGVYSAVVVALVVRSVLRSQDGFGVWFLYTIERLYVPLMFRWRATNGPSPLPSSGGALVIANHRSPIDPMMVWMNHHLRTSDADRAIRVIGFLTAREYCSPPGLGWLVRTMQSIPVDRNGQDMGPTREAIRRLRDGRLVGIFPEGGISMGADLSAPNTGVAFLALKAGVPVYPVYIHGTSFDESSGMVAPFTRRQTVRVTYGSPIDLSEYSSRRVTQELLVDVTNLLMSELSALGGVGYTTASLPVEATANSRLSVGSASPQRTRA
ncbi:hypothetical protein GC176_14200 [bacterium]|nr:hypothetical protein [bacterium]